MTNPNLPPESGDDGFIYTRYITRNGVRIYHPTGGVFRIPKDKLKKK